MGLHGKDLGKGSTIRDFEVVTKSGEVFGTEAMIYNSAELPMGPFELRI